MKRLERRIQKIEALLPEMPCPNSNHEELRILMFGVTPEQDRENDALIESVKNCEYCKVRAATGNGPSVIMFRTFAKGSAAAPDKPVAPQQRERVKFVLGDT